MKTPDEQMTKDQLARRQEVKAAERAKILERARRTGRETSLSNLSAKAAATKPFMSAYRVGDVITLEATHIVNPDPSAKRVGDNQI